MKTKQRTSFVVLLLLVAILFGTIGALSFTNDKSVAYALSSVTVDESLTDWEKNIDSKMKITQDSEITVLKNGAYVIPYWTFSWADVDRAEYSIDIYKCSQFRMYIAKEGHYIDSALPSYTCKVSEGKLTFSRYAESQYYGAKDVDFDGYTVKLPTAGDVTKLSISVEYGFNIKATYYGANYTAVKKSTGEAEANVGSIINYTITPYNEDGTLNTATAKDIFYYSALTQGTYDTTVNTYKVGLVMLGDNLESVVDNAKLVTYSSIDDATGTEKVNNPFNTDTGIQNVPYGNRLNVSVRNNAGTRVISDEIINNADAIVYSNQITDSQFVIDGDINLTSLDNGKKFGLLTGMDAKMANVGAAGTSYAYFTNVDGLTYFGYASDGGEDTLVPLGTNFAGTTVAYTMQYNDDGRVVAKINGETILFNVPKANVNGYIAFKSSGAGSVSASIGAAIVDTYNVSGEMTSGASIRLTSIDKSGLRFETKFDNTAITALETKLENGEIKSIQYGTLITRKDLIGNNTVTFEALTKNSVWHKNVVSTTGFIDSIADATSQGYWGSIVSIQGANYNKQFIGRGYVKIVDGNDNELYFYADFAEGDIDNNSRSVYSVAKSFYSDSANYTAYADSLEEGEQNVVITYLDGVVDISLAEGNLVTYNGDFEGYERPYIVTVEGDVLTVTSTSKIAVVVINGKYVTMEYSADCLTATCLVSAFAN